MMRDAKFVENIRNAIPAAIMVALFGATMAIDWGLNKLSKKAKEWKSIDMGKALKESFNFSKIL